jgi:hypothetical protein
MEAGPQYAQPPSRVCARCGAQGLPGAERCHACGKSYESSSSLWWILGIATAVILALIVLLAIACGSIIGGAGDLAGEGLDVAREELERVQRQSAITQDAYASVKPRTSRSAVETKLGKPADVSATGSRAGLPAEPPGTSCLYYFERGQSVFAGPTFRFCFARNRLARKDVL